MPKRLVIKNMATVISTSGRSGSLMHMKCECVSNDEEHKSGIETIEHIYWECPITQHPWLQLVNFLNNRGIMITLNIMDVCIGTDQCRNHHSAINFVLTTFLFSACIYYIYIEKC